MSGGFYKVARVKGGFTYRALRPLTDITNPGEEECN
jgi:hypothetical protein